MRKSAYTPNLINSLPVVMVLGMLDLLLLVLMLKIMFSDHSSQELGHRDLVSGLVGHLDQRHLNAKLEVMKCASPMAGWTFYLIACRYEVTVI